MLGIRFLRMSLGKSGDEFANILGTTKSTVSLWENGKRRIPQEKKALLCSQFGIWEEVLDAEVDEADKAEIRKCLAEHNQTIPRYILDEWTRQDEEQDHKMTADLNDFMRKLYEAQRKDPKLYSLIKQVYEICQMSYGEVIVSLLLTAVRQYYGVSTTGDYIAVGKTDYTRGLYRKDDSALAIITSLLQMIIPAEQAGGGRDEYQ